jgi:hypothetical protein
VSNLADAHVAHHNLAIIVAADDATMDEVLQIPELRALIWRRLDETRALVDPERIASLRKRLTERKLANQFKLVCR